MRSSLEIYDLDSGEVRIVMQTNSLIEAPNWDALRSDLIVNGEGQLFRVCLTTGAMLVVET